MYCPKCGKANPEGGRFCMHCGADLNGHKVEIKPEIEVSPKIEAKAEGVPYPKWKPLIESYVEVKSEGKLPVYSRFAEFDEKPFCPQCGCYDSLNKLGEESEIVYENENRYLCKYILYKCLNSTCGKKFLKFVSKKSENVVIYAGSKSIMSYVLEP